MTNNVIRISHNVTSYDTGNKPYKHDFARGKWATRWDFYAVALSHCFGFRHFLMHMVFYRAGVVPIIISHILGMVFFMLPLYFTQMFMGQFSSTGIISVFRIAPLFKGVGYISLFLNLLSCSYFMVIAAFPLYIVFASMQSNLPWSHCSNHFNSELCVVIKPESVNTSWSSTDFYNEYYNKTLPTHEFLSFILNGNNEEMEESSRLSWRILLCTLLIWILISAVLFKGIETFGKIFRFITAASFICMLLTFLRILCVPESWEAIGKFFTLSSSYSRYLHYIVASPILALSVFGAGWGNVLTIASYNNFKEDIGKLSFITCFIQIFTFLITCICFTSIETYLEKHFGYMYFNYSHFDVISLQFVIYALYFSHLGWPQFWTILFFAVIFLTQFAEGALQMLTILTAIYDEYEFTRIYKNIVLGGLVGFFGFISIFFCSADGFGALKILYPIAGANKLVIILIELLVVLWIYGRLRFQRDVRFMTGKPMKSWKIWIMRFLTPIGILIALLYATVESFMQVRFISSLSLIVIFVFLFLKLTPLLYVPGYMIYKVSSATGTILERIRKLCVPNDWYPVDPIERRTYADYTGSTDINDLVHANVLTESVHF
ncbi:sodium-dependent proline transporter-like [Condylostylus longicornis]|uniref:sodium-dependent proline transporter-like n=1 Tax=Condylostylus longicornis TaxID=2530218 RepID=UPI00244DF0E3|nr:sodium-dependent proline transporter-like [Condylostylus longicornis]